MVAESFSVGQALRSFAQSLKSVTAVEAVGLALAAIAVQLGFPDLMITDVDAAFTHPALAVLFSVRPREEWVAYLAGSPAETNPVLNRSWTSAEPCSFTDIKDELRLTDDELWSMTPPWARNQEALSVNVEAAGKRLNFAYGGGAVDGTVRSILFVASALAGERLTELASGAKPPKLTKREWAVLQAITVGQSDREVASILGIAERTVRFHVENAKRKLGVATRAQAVLMVLREGLP